jgi:outer membrane protein OmpU
MKLTTLTLAALATTALTTIAACAEPNLSVDGSARLGVKSSEAADGTTSTSAINRVRLAFTGSVETDMGLEMGATIRADNAADGNAGTAGSQWISGSFGKLSMGDLNGADENAVGDVNGVGVSGLGDYNELSYNSSNHDLGYTMNVGPVSVGMSTNTSDISGDNMALGATFSMGIMDDTNVAVSIGQSTVGAATQTSMGAATTVMGVTAGIVMSEDDNGADAATSATAISASFDVAGVSATIFQKNVTTVGAIDKSYQGVGVGYNLGGGSTAKFGVAKDDAGVQQMDVGISFSF